MTCLKPTSILCLTSTPWLPCLCSRLLRVPHARPVSRLPAHAAPDCTNTITSTSKQGAGPVSLDGWMRQSYEAAAICPKSLEMQPCTCSGKCECTPQPAHAYCDTLSSPAAPLHHSLGPVSSVTASSIDRPRGPVHPLYRASCATRARTHA